jgi:hypothetical protein
VAAADKAEEATAKMSTQAILVRTMIAEKKEEKAEAKADITDNQKVTTTNLTINPVGSKVVDTAVEVKSVGDLSNRRIVMVVDSRVVDMEVDVKTTIMAADNKAEVMEVNRKKADVLIARRETTDTLAVEETPTLAQAMEAAEAPTTITQELTLRHNNTQAHRGMQICSPVS